MFDDGHNGLWSRFFPQPCFDPLTLAAIASAASTVASTVGSFATTIAPIAGLAGAGLTAAGTIASGNAAAAAGKMQQQQGLMAQKAAEYEAQQLEIKAKEERAAGQREAYEYQRRKDLALSSLQARAGASGFSATDPSTLAIADEIARYGTLQEQVAMYGGESKARGINAGAATRRMEGEMSKYAGDMAYYEGKAKKSASRLDAAGTIIGGISGLATKYNPGAKTGAASSYRYG